MKTKTPEQIHNQVIRIYNKLVDLGHWEGRKWIASPNMEPRMKFISSIRARYIDNIYKANNHTTNGHGIATSGTTTQINYIWFHAATPASIYTK